MGMKNATASPSSIENSHQSQPEKAPANFWLTARTNVRLRYLTPPVQPAPRDQALQLSFNQERLWFLEQLQPSSSVQNLQHALQLNGKLNVAALEQSLSEIVRRHEVLRTQFATANGQPVQVIASDVTLDWSIVDLQQLDPEQQQAEIERLTIVQAEQPFDLMQAPLWRVQLLRLAEEKHILLRTIHHVIFDAWSHGVFMRELGALYEAFTIGAESPLSELPIQYVDFAYSQRQWLQGEVLSSQLNYWKQQLGGTVPALELPIDQARSTRPSYQGACESRLLPASLTQALKALSHQQGVSLFDTLLTAFQTLLYQYTQQSDMLVCSPVAGRHRAETKGVIGYFNNVVVLRTDLSEDPSFRDLVNRVSVVGRGAFEHQDVPLQMVAELPDVVRTPLTRALFVLQNTPNPTLELTDLTVSSVYVNRSIANFDLSLSIEEKAGQLQSTFQYKTDLFKADTITHLLNNFLSLLERLVEQPDLHLSDLPVLTTPTNQQPEKNSSAPAFVAPRTDLERQLVRIWESVLNIQLIGIQDNFFDLGGHSLLAVSLFAQIESVFGQVLPLSTLITAPTIAQLADLLNQAEQPKMRECLVLLKSGTAKASLFLVHDGDGETLLYRSLAYHLDPNLPVYGIQPYGCSKHPILHTRISDMVNYYIQQIRTVQPEGPYLLGGLCAGGSLAFEIARQLQKQGQQVAMVAIIDAADVEATHRVGLIASKRLNSFSQMLQQNQHLNSVQKGAYILNQIRRKATNLVAYECQQRLTFVRDRSCMKLFRYCLDEQLPLPQFLQQIPVRTTYLFAEQEYLPESPFEGEVVLFRATEKSNAFDGTGIDDTPYVEIYSDPLLGWGKRVTRGVKAFDIPGGHSSMLQEPNVRVMAEIMQSYIDAASSNAVVDLVSAIERAA
jgi:thioesterase domain-containing protein/acyl carrier protein